MKRRDDPGFGGGALCGQHPRLAPPVIEPDRPSVVLVDDDPVFSLLTQSALEQAGYAVEAFSAAEGVLKALAGRSVSAVVLDAVMPDVDGFELCRRLRAQPEHRHLPVLMLTGLGDDASIDRAYRSGATDFLVKTSHYTLLIGRLQHMLRAAQTRLELERSQARLARAQALARMGSCEWTGGRSGLPVDFSLSPEGRLVLGLSPDEAATPKRILKLVHPQDRRGLLRLLDQAARARAPIKADVVFELGRGERRVMHLDAEPEWSDGRGGLHYTGVIQDFTDRRNAEDRIRHLAEFDPLTGLPNRRQIIWRAERALEASRARGHRMAVLLVDLDRFKLINDTLGHTIGDELLIEVARRLRTSVRHVDEIHQGNFEVRPLRAHRRFEAVGRLGGDEFIAVLPEIDSTADALRAAHRILDALRKPMVLGGQECFVTASIGLALHPGDGDTVMDLLRHADIAMYAVKADGRNSAIAYDPALSRRARERLELETALHKALERGELLMCYQPTIDANRSRVVSAEALMRWQRDGRLTMPGEFIPVAEETGLIVPMTEWALREVARQIRRWRDEEGLDITVAVNMPARMLRRMGLLVLVEDICAEAGISPRSLRLEITETTLMDSVEEVMEVLSGLRTLGVEISIDDFGTGYSSLVHFTRHPIGELKIDRAFVHDLGHQARSEGVVAAVIAMARALELRVVAEGVETVGQFDILCRLGCTQMQGYLFARPMMPADFVKFTRAVLGRPEEPWRHAA